MTATDTQRQAAMILQGDPHTPALYRLLQPCEKRDELEREPMTQQQLLVDQATRERLYPDDRHERNRPCPIKR